MQSQRVTQAKTAETSRQRSAAASIERPVSARVLAHPILQLQQTIGNQAVQRLLQSRTMQAKLAISQPGDIYEQEADRLADEVMRMPEPTLQRFCAPCAAGGAPCPTCEDEKARLVQRKAEQPSDAASVPDDFFRSLGPGQPLDPAARAYFEPRFGHDFSQVRVHDDSRAAESARSVNAQAYTVGRNVIFSAGQYAPKTQAGQRLIAHELTHVVRQAAAPTHGPIEIMPPHHPSEAAAEAAAAHERRADSASPLKPAKAEANHAVSARALQRRAIDDDAHVTCRATRPTAFAQIQAAETEAIRMLQLAAEIGRQRARVEALVDIIGETAGRHAFRDALWRRFRANYEDKAVRDGWLHLIPRRFDWLANAIARFPIVYRCGAPGVEPAGDCTNRVGQGVAWSELSGNDIQLCDAFWSFDQPRAVLHEWFHLGFGLVDAPFLYAVNACCWDAFVRELAGEATAEDEVDCCTPPPEPLPPLAGAGAPTLQRAASSPVAVQKVPPIVHEVLLSPGQPLEAATRAYFEPRFGQDFSQVRVHTDDKAAESAREVGALAYTIGHDVVLRQGQYAPGTLEGRRLLAHELAHVVQQNGGAETVPQTHRPVGVLQRKSGGAARGTYPFSVTTSGCDKAPFNKATVEDAAKKAFEQVRDTDCVKTASLREDILAEFSGLSIECKQGVSKTSKNACAEAPGETSDVSLFGIGVELNCGPLEGVVLHEVVHLLERAFLKGHGDLTYACQESCFPGASQGRGDPSRCTFEKGLMPVVGASGGVGFSREGSPAWVARFYVGFEKRVVGVVHPSLGFGYALIGESTSGKPGGTPSSTTSLNSLLLGLRVDPGLPGGGYLSLSGGPAVAIGNKTAAIGAEVGVAFGFRWRVLDISLDAGISYDPTRETGMETNYTLGATIRFGRSVPRR